MKGSIDHLASDLCFHLRPLRAMVGSRHQRHSLLEDSNHDRCCCCVSNFDSWKYIFSKSFLGCLVLSSGLYTRILTSSSTFRSTQYGKLHNGNLLYIRLLTALLIRNRFIPGLLIMEGASLFFPLYEVYANRKHSNQTMAIIQEWENKRRMQNEDLYSGGRAGKRTSVTTDDTRPTASDASSRRSDIYSRQALDKALEQNPEPLLVFASTRQFTGENIVFLIQVRDFKRSWAQAVKQFGNIPADTRLNLFNRALSIYVDLVDEVSADIEINIEGGIRRELIDVFGPTARANGMLKPRTHHQGIYIGNMRDEDSSTQMVGVTYETSNKNQSGSPQMVKQGFNSSEENMIDRKFDGPVIERSLSIPVDTGIPTDFDEHIFDKAEASVHNMVFLNTWGRFVDSRETMSIRSSESGWSWRSTSTYETFISYIKPSSLKRMFAKKGSMEIV